MITTDDMLEAYYDCRKSKRSTASAVMYEIDYESKLVSLRDRINTRTYSPGKSICFVVTRPRYREVFAASFEDRIVHHYIALRLEPLFEAVFSPRTYNCRKGKGQLYGINMLRYDIYDCSQGYTTDCWIMKLDLKGFFMSIRKDLLAEKIDNFILQYYKGDDIEDLRFVCRTVIMHCPEKLCERHSPLSFWEHLSEDKSLFTNGDGKGVAIGNLFAQLFANFYLNELDWYLDSVVRHHGRYVDDFYCISTDKKLLLSLVPKIREMLGRWGLRLNERKFYLQHYAKGVQFTGTIVKPYRSYICNTSLSNLRNAVMRLNNADNPRNVRYCIQSINSYLGLMRHNNEYGNRVKMVNLINDDVWKYFYVKGRYESLRIRRQYTKEYETLMKIKSNKWDD